MSISDTNMVLMAETLQVKCKPVKCEHVKCETVKCETIEEVFDPSMPSPEDPLNNSTQSTESCPNFVNQSMNSAKKGRKRKHSDRLDKDILGHGKPTYLEVKVNIVPRAEETSRPACSQVKKRHKYRDDRLELLCEWSGCGRTLKEADSFLRHVSGHCSEAGLLPNPTPLQDTFLCLWDECGFQTTDSRETVRHINFHSFHTKVKAAGAALVARLGLTPCSLSREGRNLLPQLSLPWTCSWPGCVVGEDWEVAQHFYWHVGGHASSLRTSLQCRWPGCSRTDTAVSKLREHMRCHSQEKLVACPTCGGLFASRAKFLDHLSRQETNQQFPCTTCAKAFSTPRLLRDHMRSHVMQYQCPACAMTCPTPSTLATHMRYRHTTDRPHTCQFCSYRGKTLASMRSHSKVHFTEAEVKCREQGCSFSCRAALTMARHHSRKHSSCQAPALLYCCHLCGERRQQGGQLSRHLVTEHGLSLPTGHSRFRYTVEPGTGLRRLQTQRLESDNLVVPEVEPGLTGEEELAGE